MHIIISTSVHAHYSLYHMVDQKQPFLPVCCREGFFFLELLLLMPPGKVCPQCDAVVPIRLKVCKSCQHVFRTKRQIEHTLPARAMKRLRVAVSDSVKLVMKAKTSCKGHVKEQQSLANKHCIDSSITKNIWQV